MKLYALVAIIIAMLLLSASPSDALRGTRKQCRKTCGPRIQQDCREFRRAGKRACRRSILRACRNVTMDACLLASETPTTTSTTVTTTSAVPPTTQLPATTTTFVPHTFPTTTTHANSTTTHTTTSKPPSTTTTTAPFHYGGDWTLFSELGVESVDCVDNAPFIDREVIVSHAPGASDIDVGIELMPSLSGTADASGFEVQTEVDLGNGCTRSVYLLAERSPQGTSMGAELIIDTSCPDDRCTAWYFGDLEQ
jgi:hypothetical protein